MLTAESIVDKLRNNTKLAITLNAPAAEADLSRLEDILNRKLPADIIDFYLLANGFETLDYIFRVLPIEEIIQYQNELPDNEIFFAEYMIYSDNWRIVFDDTHTERYSIINDDHGRGEAIILTNSIFEFFERYLGSDGVMERGGLFYWRKETMAQHVQTESISTEPDETPVSSSSQKPIRSKTTSLLQAIQGLAVIYLIVCLVISKFILAGRHQIPARTKLIEGLNIFACIVIIIGIALYLRRRKLAT